MNFMTQHCYMYVCTIGAGLNFYVEKWEAVKSTAGFTRAENDPELMILLPHPQSWDSRGVPPHLVFVL